jgi:hypothetical protein
MRPEGSPALPHGVPETSLFLYPKENGGKVQLPAVWSRMRVLWVENVRRRWRPRPAPA